MKSQIEEAVKKALKEGREIPNILERFDGKLMRVEDSSRSGWFRFHKHYDRDGYCDNPARGY